jgi:hypothetical protein
MNRHVFLLSLIASIFPGIGHFFIGYRKKGLIIFFIWIVFANILVLLGDIGRYILFIWWILLVYFSVRDIWNITKKSVDADAFSDLKKIHRTVGSWILGYMIFLIIGIIIIAVIIGILVLSGWSINIASKGVDMIVNTMDDNNGIIHKNSIGSIIIDYKYLWQGAINDGFSSYSINGYGSKTNNVKTKNGLISVSAQKMDGSSERLIVCINSECQSTTTPYGVVSLAKWV